MMKKRKYLAFDLGASSGRAIIGEFDGSKLTLREAHRFDNGAVSVNSRMYWDIFSLYRNIKSGITKAGKVDSIGIDTWGVDYAFLGEDGALKTIPNHYRDLRTEGMVEEALQLVGEKRLYECTGLPNLKLNTLYQLLASKRDAEIPERSKLLFMPDLLASFICGDARTEYSIASTSQMLNVHTRRWDKALVQDLGLPTDILTDIIEPGTIRGRILPELASETGADPDTRMIAVAGHDTASAVAAVPASGKYAYISSGTWSLMGIESEKPLISQKAHAQGFANEGGVYGTYRILKNIMGMWIEQECLRNFRKKQPELGHADMVMLAEKAKPFTAFIDPDDDLFFSPGDMPENIREYCRATGQHVPEDIGTIMRIAFESLALKYNQVLSTIEELSGPVESLNIVGGGTQNKMVNAFTANACARTVNCGPIEATAIGNILMQGVAMGDFSSLASARECVKASFDIETYESHDTASWAEAYETYKKVCQR